MVHYNRSPIPQQFENRFEAFEESQKTTSSSEGAQIPFTDNENPDVKEDNSSKDTFSASSSGSTNNMFFILILLLLFDAF